MPVVLTLPDAIPHALSSLLPEDNERKDAREDGAGTPAANKCAYLSLDSRHTGFPYASLLYQKVARGGRHHGTNLCSFKMLRGSYPSQSTVLTANSSHSQSIALMRERKRQQEDLNVCSFLTCWCR